MSTSEQITRIQTARNTIRTKLVELGLTESTAQIDDLATVVAGISNNGSVSAEVKEGETYTIPKGYHNGSGTVSGVAGGGNYSLQSKTVTPTKSEQNIVPDAGSYGLSDVTVAAIPENYQDVTSVDATAADVLANKKIVDSTGKLLAGTMTNNGAVAKSLSTADTSYTIPAGYHNGSGKVSITTEAKTATPTETEQTITPTSGKVLSKVTVSAIPSNYITTDDATATAEGIIEGETAYVNGVKVEGTMPNNLDISKTLDATADNQSFTIPKGYHNGEGSVNVLLETKTATPTEAEQTITPSTGKVLSKVTVNPIPENYKDISDVTAHAWDVKEGAKFIDADGNLVEGNMPIFSGVHTTLDASKDCWEIPEGYYDGTCTADIYLEEKTVTPTKSAQTINATAGKVISSVTVNAIPDAYQDVTGVTATADKVLTGSTFVDKTGAEVAGTMKNNGAITLTMDGLSTTSVSIPAGYTSGGTVSLTDDIETMLAAI